MYLKQMQLDISWHIYIFFEGYGLCFLANAATS
jgi:hypothetical protein